MGSLYKVFLLYYLQIPEKISFVPGLGQQIWMLSNKLMMLLLFHLYDKIKVNGQNLTAEAKYQLIPLRALKNN